MGIVQSRIHVGLLLWRTESPLGPEHGGHDSRGMNGTHLQQLQVEQKENDVIYL
jgi:hypothetical protein